MRVIKMATILKVKIEYTYGTERIYPACELSHIICSKLLKKKTLDRNDTDALKQLGFEIQVVMPTL